MAAVDLESDNDVTHHSIPAVPIPLGISGAFFLIVHPGGRALVYPGAFDSLVIFTSQYCHFLLVVSSSRKDDTFVMTGRRKREL